MAKTKSLLSLFPLKLFFIKAFQMHFNFKLKVYLENAIKLIFFGMFFLYTLPSYPWTLSSFFVSKYHVIRYEKNDDVVSLLYKTFKAHTHTMKSVNKVSSYIPRTWWCPPKTNKVFLPCKKLNFYIPNRVTLYFHSSVAIKAWKMGIHEKKWKP